MIRAQTRHHENKQSKPFTFSFSLPHLSLSLSQNYSLSLSLSVSATMSKGPGLFSDIGKKAKGEESVFLLITHFSSSFLYCSALTRLRNFLLKTLRFGFVCRSSNEGLQLRSEVHRLHLQRCRCGRHSKL